MKKNTGRILFWLTGCVLILIFGSSVYAQYTPEEILKVLPSQKDIAIDSPAAGEIPSCKIIEFSEGKFRGVCLTKPDGQTPLRVWCAPEGSSNVEQVRFYKNGNEVFRDLLETERSCRWLSDTGSRWAVLNSDKKIIQWKKISPEEATAEIVAALVTNDLQRYKRVSLSEADLQSLGLTEPLLSSVQEKVKAVDTDFAKVAAALKIPANVQWGAFNGSRPGLLAAGSRGVKEDIPVYYNASIVLVNKENTAQNHQIFLGDLVQINGVWKAVGLPSGEPFGKSGNEIRVSSVFFPISGDNGGALPEVSGDYTKLAEQLNEAYHKLESASDTEYAALCETTFSLLLNLAARNPNEENDLVMQASDLLFTAIQRGLYPQGVEKLNQLCETYKDSKNQELLAHLKLRQIEGEFFAKTQTNPPLKRTELEKEQTKHTDALIAFAEKYSNTNAGITTLMFLAQDFEYLQDDEKAIQYYSIVVKNSPNSPAGRKAAGAVKRIEAIGKVFALPAWNYIEGGKVNAEEFAGKNIAVFCWASWIPEEIDQLKSFAAKNDNLAVIGVNMDSTPETAAEFLKSQKLPWKNVCENGGLDGSNAVALGVQNVPLIILIDKNGKVVRPNIQNVSELEILLKK